MNSAQLSSWVGKTKGRSSRVHEGHLFLRQNHRKESGRHTQSTNHRLTISYVTLGNRLTILEAISPLSKCKALLLNAGLWTQHRAHISPVQGPTEDHSTMRTWWSSAELSFPQYLIRKVCASRTQVSWSPLTLRGYLMVHIWDLVWWSVLRLLKTVSILKLPTVSKSSHPPNGVAVTETWRMH